MNHQQLLDYNKAQRNEISAFKWTESEKAGRDLFPGKDGNNKAAFVWISLYAQSFNKYWASFYNECQ